LPSVKKVFKMDLSILRTLSHHAYCLLGERDSVRDALLDFLNTELSFPSVGNPDFWMLSVGTLSIDAAREVREVSFGQPVSFPYRIIVVGASDLTREAQNALLKIFEDPPAQARFFLIVPSVERLLPTLLSRFLVIRATKSRVQQMTNESASFLKSTLAARLKIVQPIIREKDKAKALSLLDGLERCFAEAKDMPRTDKVKNLEQLLTLKSYLADRSASIKLILEHTALAIPVIKR